MSLHPLPGSAPAASDPTGSGQDIVREDITFEVVPSVDPSARWKISAQLLIPAGGADTVQLLLPGLTYDRRYWQVPGEYDYAAHMVRAGYAVLLLDRIGTGASSRPPANEVTADTHVETLKPIVAALREGTPGGHSFARVVSVGHSYGAGLAIVAAARHADVDGVVVTGMLHTTSPMYDEVINFFHPGSEDPVLADPSLPQWYMTQRPGLRAKMLEYAEGIDEELSLHNEQVKSTATIGEGESLPQTYLSEFSNAITAHVLLVVGEHDALFSSADVGFAATSEAVEEFEKDFYTSSASLTTHVLPGTGHSLNLHRTAPRTYQLIHDWLRAHLAA